ncbi:MAG: aldo/keto reductase [Acidimicrobiales bacterium]
MQTRRLGSLNVSLIGLGCNNFGMRIHDSKEATGVVAAALDAGINYFDTADAYSDGTSESWLGEALNNRRGEALVATKFRFDGRDEGGLDATRKHIRSSLEASRQRLGIDAIDHYQLHKPDGVTPMAETLVVLQELMDEGLIRATGCSNFSADQLDEAADAAEAEGVSCFHSVQNRYSVLTRLVETDGVLEACQRHSVAFVPYFPLESGLLTGRVTPAGTPAPGSRLEAWAGGDLGDKFLGEEMVGAATALGGYAEGRNRTLLELAFSWLAAQGQVVSIIAGATSDTQVRANAGAGDWAMSDAEIEAVNNLVAAELGGG